MKTIIGISLLVIALYSNPMYACGNLPFWQNTLQCHFFPDSSQTPPPPPVVPQTVDQIKDFTLVPLPFRSTNMQEVLRCVDGTQPAIYVDEATAGPSDDWVISFQGGGSCSDGQSCVNAYLDPTERGEMGTAMARASKNMEGIHRSTASNVFSAFNRVRIEKCGYDRYNGASTQRGVTATIDSDFNGNSVQAELINEPGVASHNPVAATIVEGEEVTVDLFHHGAKIVLHTLDQLRDGLTYRSWEDNGAGAVVGVQKSLPPLSNAESILFAGHSGAAHGLMNTIDEYANYLSNWVRSVDDTPFTGSVRVLFDAQLLPSIEGEAAFNDYLNGDLYDQLTLCREPCESGAPLHYTYDGMRYFSSGGLDSIGFFDGPDEQWNVPLDSSCLNDHPHDSWRCADRFHVLFNHISTAFFIRQDFSDPNEQHNNNPQGHDNHGHRLFWADPQTDFCENPDGVTMCEPRLSAAEFRARVSEQAKRFISGFSTRSEMAASGLPIPTVFLWLPDCKDHKGAFDDHQFFVVELKLKSSTPSQQTSMHDYLLDFVQTATTGTISRRIDGENDVRSLCN